MKAKLLYFPLIILLSALLGRDLIVDPRLTIAAGSNLSTWAVSYDNPGREWDIADMIIESSQGGYIVAGATLNTGSRNPAEAWVIHLNEDGSSNWQKTYLNEGPRVYHVNGLVEVEDGYLMLLYTPIRKTTYNVHRSHLLKIDFDGELIWQRELKSDGQISDNSTIRYLNLEADNEFIYLVGSMGLGSYSQPAIVKMNSEGEFLNVRSISYNDRLPNYSREAIARGTIHYIEKLENGNLAIASTISYGNYHPKPNNSDILVSILDTDLNVLYQVPIEIDRIPDWGSNQFYPDENVTSLKETSDGGLMLFGNQDSRATFFIKLDQAYDVDWIKFYTTTTYDQNNPIYSGDVIEGINGYFLHGNLRYYRFIIEIDGVGDIVDQQIKGPKSHLASLNFYKGSAIRNSNGQFVFLDVDTRPSDTSNNDIDFIIHKSSNGLWNERCNPIVSDFELIVQDATYAESQISPIDEILDRSSNVSNIFVSEDDFTVRDLDSAPEYKCEYDDTIRDLVDPTASFSIDPHYQTYIPAGTNLPININANDNPGGSGIQHVSAWAFYDDEWHPAGLDSTAPYQINWEIPINLDPQEIQIGIHVVDNAGNYVEDPVPPISRNLISGTPSITPVIFVPGIEGSTLRLSSDPDSRNAERWIANWTKHQDLSLDPDNLGEPLVATDILRSVGGGIFKIYQPLITSFIDEGGYVEYELDSDPSRLSSRQCDFDAQALDQPTLFLFPYDWRLDNQVSARKLADYVECIQRFYPGTDVNIVAHSMGGLVSSHYILSEGGESHVDQLITMGTPFLGTPQAIYVLETGDQGIINWIAVNQSTLKELGQYFPGAHQLLPGSAYFELSVDPVIIEKDWELNIDGVRGEMLFDQYVTGIDNRYATNTMIYNPGTETQAFHTNDQDNWSSNESNVSYTHFYGVNQWNDDTVVTIQAVHEAYCTKAISTPQGVAQCVEYSDRQVFASSYGPGDGTVTELSATRISPFGNYNDPNAKLCRVEKKYWVSQGSGRQEHQAMAKDNDVLITILSQLQPGNFEPIIECANSIGREKSTLLATEPQGPEETPLFNKIILTGVELFSITDNLSGVTTEIEPGVFILPDGIIYHKQAPDQHVLFVTAGATYSVDFEIGESPVTVEVVTGNIDGNSQASRWIDIQNDASKSFRLTTNDTSINLSLDNDGNSSYETVITPTATAVGPNANDETGPTVTIEATDIDELKEVFISAVDTESGVKILLYSLDGSTYHEYTVPLLVNPNEHPVIFAFADDNMANRSSLVILDFAAADEKDNSIYIPFLTR